MRENIKPARENVPPSAHENQKMSGFDTNKEKEIEAVAEIKGKSESSDEAAVLADIEQDLKEFELLVQQAHENASRDDDTMEDPAAKEDERMLADLTFDIEKEFEDFEGQEFKNLINQAHQEALLEDKMIKDGTDEHRNPKIDDAFSSAMEHFEQELGVLKGIIKYMEEKEEKKQQRKTLKREAAARKPPTVFPPLQPSSQPRLLKIFQKCHPTL